MTASAQAQDGARAYFLLPAGTNDIDLTATLIHTEFDGSVFDSTVFTPSYRRAIDLSGDAAEFLIGVPAGSLSASLNTPFGTIESHTAPVQGDLFVGGTLGLVGSPALSPMQYAQFKPGLAISVATKLFLPTGDYNSTRLLNLGGNRWSLQTSLPIVYTLGNSLLDPDLTTFEIVPSVQVFGDNKNAFGPATVISEAPLFGILHTALVNLVTVCGLPSMALRSSAARPRATALPILTRSNQLRWAQRSVFPSVNPSRYGLTMKSRSTQKCQTPRAARLWPPQPSFSDCRVFTVRTRWGITATRLLRFADPHFLPDPVDLHARASELGSDSTRSDASLQHRQYPLAI